MEMLSDRGKDKIVVDIITAAGLVVEGALARGKVLAVGEQVQGVKIGDEIWFEKASGTDMILYGKKLKILGKPEICGFAEQTPAGNK